MGGGERGADVDTVGPLEDAVGPWARRAAAAGLVGSGRAGGKWRSPAAAGAGVEEGVVEP